jgi:hypothetical protein
MKSVLGVPGVPPPRNILEFNLLYLRPYSHILPDLFMKSMNLGSGNPTLGAIFARARYRVK